MALPAPNIARPVHSVATHAYLLHLPGMLFAIRLWACAFTNRTNRIPSIITSHREDTVARAPPVSGAVRLYSRTLTPTSTIAPTSSGSASTIDTRVGSEAIELDGTKGPSTSSLAETNDAEPGVPIIQVRVDLVSEAIEPSHPTACPMVEVDIADVDIVVIGDQSCL